MELIIGIAIIGILIAVILPNFFGIRENQTLKNGLQDTLSAINKAKSQTLSSLDSSEYGVHFESDSVIIFKGKIFSSEASDNEVIQIFPPATISAVNLTGGAEDFYFNRLSGEPSAIGTITISNSSLSKTISILASGAVGLD